MEDINNSNVGTPTSSPVVAIGEQQTEILQPDKKRKNNPLIYVLVFFIVLLAGGIAYLFFTDKIELSFLDDTTDNEVEENLDEDANNETSDENENTENEDTEDEVIVETKEYYNSTQGVKFRYPSDWKIEKEITNESGFYVSFSENIGNPDFIFEYDLPAVSGPEACYFSDTDNPDEIVMGTLYDNYVTINENDTLRRTYSTRGGTESYRICKKISSTFVNWIDSGYVSYKVKNSRSDAQEMMKLMDKILLSFEYTGNIGV